MNEKTVPPLKKKTRKYFTVYILVVVILGSFAGGVFAGRDQQTAQAQIQNQESDQIASADFSLFWNVLEEVNSKFVGRPLDQQEAIYGAVKGMVQSTNDPYSQFLDPEETKIFNSQIEGKFEGIGAEIGMRNGVLTIIAPLSESPAEKAGLQPQDIVLKIDDESTEGLSVDEAVQKIRGEKGSVVKLEVYRESSQETLNIEITRDTIQIESVKLEILDNNIALVRITSFSGDTVSRMNEVANQIEERNVNGIIIDVRNNPGGLLDVGINITSLFVNHDDVILIEDQGNGDQKEFKAARNNKLNDKPVVVLMNEGSASASEILAGALRDLRNVPLIGSTSYGKGSVQDYEFINVPNVDDPASLRITIARWLTPNGTSIEGNGLTPSTEVTDNPDTEEDEVILKALEELAN